jgi:hypothetical protein
MKTNIINGSKKSHLYVDVVSMLFLHSVIVIQSLNKDVTEFAARLLLFLEHSDLQVFLTALRTTL